MAPKNGGVSSFDSLCPELLDLILERASSFDLLCPELLDLIFEKAARDNPLPLKQLARVNTAFSDAAKRYAQALVLRTLEKKPTQEAPHACEVLEEELRSRPKLSRLVVKEGAPTSLLGAVATVAWRSASIKEGPSVPPLSAVQCAQRLSAARVSMRSLDLTSSSFHLSEDIPSIVEYFPNLEHLQLCGQSCSQRLQMEDIRSNLKSLDVSLLVGRSSFFLSLLKSLKGISSLKIKDKGPFFFSEAFRGLKCLYLVDRLRFSLSDPFLQHLAELCPNLEQLLLYSGETDERASRASEQPLTFSACSRSSHN
jgi:hypothetical protein